MGNHYVLFIKVPLSEINQSIETQITIILQNLKVILRTWCTCGSWVKHGSWKLITSVVGGLASTAFICYFNFIHHCWCAATTDGSFLVS